MKQRKLLSLLLALAMVFAMLVPAAATEETPAPVEPYAIPDVDGKLVVLHTNDTHGHDEAVEGETVGTAGVAALKADFEAAGATVLLLSAGDFSQGTTLVSLDKGASAVAFMNAAGYDAATLGNHEFDYKMEALNTNVEAAKFPVLAANIVVTETGKPLFGDHVTFDTPIGKVGVFGLDTPETMTKAHPDNVKGLTFYQGDELVKCAQEQVDALKADKCDYIIALSHLGVDPESEPNRSTDVFAKVTGVDLVIDGHSHTEIDGGQKVGDALVVSTGQYLNNVGVVVIDSDKTAAAQLVSAAAYTKVDETVAKVVNDKAAEVKAELDKVFATTEVLLNGERDPGNRTEETNLGDFAADAILWAAKQALGEDGADVALTNGGGIRATVEAGEITMNTMKTVFPFGNEVATIDLTGAELLEALEAATCSTPTAIGAFPQVAGMTFTIDIGVAYENGDQYPDSTYYAPANPGSRIKDVTVNGEALDLTATYTLATNDFTAAGGDTYGVFIGKSVYKTGVALEDALVNYTRDVLGGTITADKYGEPAGRITIVGEAAPVVPDEPKYPDDVKEGDWFYDAAAYVLDNSIMNGTGNGFEPNGVVTRGTVYQTLYNLVGRPAVAEAATFNDVEGTWYADAAAWAEDTGLTTGTGNGAFSGDRAMTRQELAKVFAEYAAGENIKPEAPADLSSFTDSANVADWAKEGMETAVALGILKGNNNALNPTGTAIRAELAQIFLNYSVLEPAAPTYTETAVQIEVPEQDGVPAHTIDAVLTLPVIEDEGSVPAVVMLHGTGSNKDEAGNGYAMAAPQMAEAGLASIRIDFMGTAADKADEYRYYSYTSANIDAKAAADYLAALDQVNAEQISVMGWSQGGTNALLAAAAYPETFSAVVTWAGALDLTGLFAPTSFADAKAAAEADGAFTMTLDWRTPSDLPVGPKWFEDVEKTDVLAETAKITVPVLAIHGEADDTVPPASAGQIAEAAADGATHMIPDCDHTFNVFSGDFTALNDAVKATSDFILGAYVEAHQAA